MPKRYSTKDLIKYAKSKNYVRISQKGSHIKFKNNIGRIAIIPQKNKEIPIGTTRSIIEQLGGDIQELENLLS